MYNETVNFKWAEVCIHIFILSKIFTGYTQEELKTSKTDGVITATHIESTHPGSFLTSRPPIILRGPHPLLKLSASCC